VTILLTGATGFLGSNILKRLLTIGYKIIIVKRSFSNTERIKQELSKVIIYDLDLIDIEVPFKNNKIDVVIHLATNYGKKSDSYVELIQDNIVFPLSLLELSQKYGVNRFINTDTLMCSNVNGYSLSKYHFNEWGKKLAKQKNIDYINVKLEHIYGPDDDDSKFVSMIVRSLINDVSCIALTDGEQKRDFIFVDDVVDAYLYVIRHKVKTQETIFEVGFGLSMSIKQIVYLIKSIIEKKTQRMLFTELNFGHILRRDNEPYEIRANIDALKKIGWTPKFDISQGLTRLIEIEMKKL
jgi:CDP-paratose synthetase